jgi:hypothetical protein
MGRNIGYEAKEGEQQKRYERAFGVHEKMRRTRTWGDGEKFIMSDGHLSMV